MYRQQLIVREKPRSSIAEAYRALRTNLQYGKVDGELKKIIFTSSGPGEGKSVTAANVATALAQGGAKVIIVDCDLRRPVQHLIFGRVADGVTNILAGKGNVGDYLQDTDVSNLKIMASGPIPPNPAELLNSNRMMDMLKTLGGKADYLIIDTPPVLPVADTCILASKVDGIILVLGAGSVRPDAAQKAKESLEQVNGVLLGVTINRSRSDEVLGGCYGYYGYYGREREGKKTAN